MLHFVIAIAAVSQVTAAAKEPARASPEDRALAFLGREVPLWSRSNHCFSCHNNGDAARALYAGLQYGFAIASTGDSPSIRPLITRGRVFLIARQQPDGSWIETTRPSGAESYAQRISTTGWAAMARLATRHASPRRRPDPKR